MRRSRSSQFPAATANVASTLSPPKPPQSKRFRSAGRTAGQASIPSTSTNTANMLGDNRFGNSTETAPNPYPLPPFKTTMATPATTSQHMDDNDRSSVSDNDSVHSPHERNEAAADASKPKPAPGKKTRGRVKIEMQYIQNKLRRYTTFSKRKSGIMKKAYELSTLTGTQVMLLVASETGHVYTFATPKLQPMITSETGKALIQTCLHTPDPAAPGGEYDIRMSVGGYEETDLGYSMNEEESFKAGLENSHLIQSTSMAPLLNSHSVVLPQGMMPMSFATSASLPDQSMGPMMPAHQLPAYSIPPTTSVVSPHSHSSPPSYSPTHSASPQRTFPGSPATVPYSQSMPPPPMMMDELASGSSPMRKSPESHYLHHGFENSPSNSPMAASHFPVRTHSPSHSGLYSGSPTMMSNHSPVAHY